MGTRRGTERDIEKRQGRCRSGVVLNTDRQSLTVSEGQSVDLEKRKRRSRRRSKKNLMPNA